MADIETRFTLDPELVARAERYAASRGETLADVVSDLLQRLPTSSHGWAPALPETEGGVRVEDMPEAVRRLREIAYQGHDVVGDVPVDWREIYREARWRDYILAPYTRPDERE